MKEFIENLIKKIVDNPDEVKVEETVDELGKVLIINSSQQDKALIIGKNGRNIRAIRTIASILGKQEGDKIFIKIAED